MPLSDTYRVCLDPRPTEMASTSVGTLHDGTYVETTCPSNQFCLVTILSTNSTQFPSSTYPPAQPCSPTPPSISPSQQGSTSTTKYPKSCPAPKFLALISMNIGKQIETSTTIRRSMASLLPEPFANQPSGKSWALKDVIPFPYQ